MAESTVGTYLGYADVPDAYKGTLAEIQKLSFKKACDITDYPNLSAPAERIETTTLSDKKRTYIKGIADTEEQEYPANFSREEFLALKTIANSNKPKVWCVLFAESEFLIYYIGQIDVSIEGKGVGDVRGSTVRLYPNDETSYDATGKWKFEDGRALGEIYCYDPKQSASDGGGLGA